MIPAEFTELNELSVKIQQLRSLYDQYFHGIERIEPCKQREAIKKELRRLAEQRRNNTAFRFRLQGAKQTLLTYEQYWDRISRQIEEGTFRRDLARAARRLAQEPPSAVKSRHEPPGDEPPPEIKKLHRAYLRARSQVGESAPLSMQNFARSLEKKRAALKTRLGCENVEFKVTIQDGRAIVRAIPR